MQFNIYNNLDSRTLFGYIVMNPHGDRLYENGHYTTGMAGVYLWATQQTG